MDEAAANLFWSTFARLQDKLAAMRSADDPSYDELLAVLHKIERHLFIEIGREPGEASELIITAEGDRKLFPLVRALVERAPVTPGWKFLALKPKVGFPLTTRWEQVEVRMQDLVFESLHRQGSLGVGLRIFLRDLDVAGKHDVLNAIYRALDHGLGEEAFAERIEHVELHALPAGAQEEDFIPLLELEHFLAWHDEKNKHLQ